MKIHGQVIFQKYISVFLLAVISFFIVPKELIHEFHHRDTEDILCMDACKDHVSNVHDHCDVLQLNTPPLHHHVTGFSFHVVSLPFSFLIKNTTTYIADRAFSFYLRGPPTLV
jgi:hypothetical protein